MEAIAKVIGILCVCSFIMGILYNLGQFPTTEKVIRFVIAIYIITTIFRTDTHYEFSFDTSFDFEQIKQENQVNSQQEVKKLIIEKTKKNLTELVKIRLKEKNISYIDVYLHILEKDNNLIVEKIQITGCDSLEKENIAACLNDLVSSQTTILLGD